MLRYYWQQARYLLPRGLLLPAAAKRLAALGGPGRILASNAFQRLYLQRVRRLAAGLRPVHFSFETQNLCNAGCSMCPSPRLERPRARLDFGVFRRGVDDAVQRFRPRAFYLNGVGEPLLAEDLVDRIVYLKKRSAATVRLFTNGSRLTGDVRARLIGSGLDELIVSLNAATDETRQRVMGLSLRETEEDVEAFLAEKRARGSPTPLVAVSFVLLPENRSEARRFVRRWQKSADLAVLAGRENWAGLSGGRAPAPRGPALPCFYLFAGVEVHSDGQVVPCCRDAEGSVVLGDLRRQTLSEAWNGAKARELRALHLEGRVDEIELCRGCDSYRAAAFHWLAAGLGRPT